MTQAYTVQRKAKKPTLDLTHPENTVVRTKTQQDFSLLLRILECGGVTASDGHSPSQFGHFWKLYGNTTCLNPRGLLLNDPAGYKEMGKKVISLSRYCAIQNPPITSNEIEQVNAYFKR